MKSRNFGADERLNRFSDDDAMWGPLLFLRPARHRIMSPTRVLAIAGLVGGFYGMLGNVILALLARQGSAGKPAIWIMPAILTSVYFVCAQLSIVAAWNRRAHLTSRRNDWVEITRRPLPAPRDDEQGAE
jgi:hypothetical protein